MSNRKNYQRKYIWGSKDFDNWIKSQSRMSRAKGIRLDPADVTHKLFHNIIIPNNINLVEPYERKKKLIRKQIF